MLYAKKYKTDTNPTVTPSLYITFTLLHLLTLFPTIQSNTHSHQHSYSHSHS